MAGWDDDDFEVPDFTTTSDALPARDALTAAGLLPGALSAAPSNESDDWFGPRAPSVLPEDTAALRSRESSAQAVQSLNTPAERKKPRCASCTRPLEGTQSKLCSRCAPGGPAKAAAPPDADDRPLILVDFTALSDGRIHNRFDKHSVNDPDAKRELANKIGAAYVQYSGDAELIARGSVRPCANSTWRQALATLRDEVPGHYWAPIFPPARAS